jgi:hypothetical protein
MPTDTHVHASMHTNTHTRTCILQETTPQLQPSTPQLQPSIERARSTFSDRDGAQEDSGLNQLQFDENDLNNAAMVPKLMAKLMQHINGHSK